MELTDLNNALAATVAVGCAVLDSSSTAGPPSVCAVYHGLAGPPDDCCDFLIAWIERLYPSKPFPAEYAARVDDCASVSMAANIAVKLRRPCWPVLDDKPPYFPQPAEFEPAALSLALDAQALWCGFFSDLAAKSQSNILRAVPGCAGFKMGAATPDANAGGCSGWTVRFSLDLGPCCVPPVNLPE